MSQSVRRVETFYSYKLPNGSLLPKGVYSVDSPSGIPDVVMKDALAKRTTVRVLEWGKVEEVPKVEPEKKVTTLDEEENVETQKVPEKKPKKSVRKRK